MTFDFLAQKVIQKNNVSKKEAVDIITFVESSWGLNQKLYPVQRIILKAHYGIALDDNPRGFDLNVRIPKDDPEYSLWATDNGPEDPETGHYKYRVRMCDWRQDPNTVRYVSEAEYLRILHKQGRCNISSVTPGKERRNLILVCGRRSGKTQMSAAIACYETYKLLLKEDPQTYYGQPQGEEINIISVATAKEQAGVLYSKVNGYYSNCRLFDQYTANSTQSYAKFQTPNDIKRYGKYTKSDPKTSTIKVSFQPCVSKGLRGKCYLAVILDEFAHFGQDGESSAEEIYTAVQPATTTLTPKDPNNKSRSLSNESEGRVIMISSPIGKSGFFYEQFQMAFKNLKASDNIVAIQAPTWEVNPTVPAAVYEAEFTRNITKFLTEFGAEFTDRARGWIDNPQDLLDCIDPKLKPQRKAKALAPHFIGLDFALVNDGSAIAIGHINDKNKIVLDVIDAIYAGKGRFAHKERLDYEDVVDWVADYSKKFCFEEGIFDQWAGLPFEQALHKKGLSQLIMTHMTPPLNSQIYQNFKDMMYDSRISLFNDPPPNKEFSPYISELLELQATVKSKYVIEVEAPPTEGKHDDMSDALVRMVWVASKHLGKDKYKVKSLYSSKPMGMETFLKRKALIHRAANANNSVLKSISRK
jgi:hypothetical protein